MTYAEAKRSSLYGRKTWVVWMTRDGEQRIESSAAATIKAALLAVGTKGAFTVLSAGNSHRIGWREGLIRFRNARAGY